MKKISILIVICLGIASCKLTDKNEKESTAAELNSAVKDSTGVNDKDENGCLASAGYIWSKINKECIKGYTGLQLNPIAQPDNEDESLSAFLLFSEDSNQAEVFLPNESTSIVLTRKAKGLPWLYQKWQLELQKTGYILKQDAVVQFSGDGEMGKKVSGTSEE
jgi:hypothetical protein